MSIDSTASLRRHRRRVGACLCLLAWAGLALAAAGCEHMDMSAFNNNGFNNMDGLFSHKVPPPPPPKPPLASYDDTVNAFADVPVQGTLLRGYGLVLLPKPTGSRECPPGIRKEIEAQLSKLRIGESDSPLGGATIDQWLNSLTTAAVEIRGYMPAGALEGQSFDVAVSALPGSQTTSLEGGVLIKTDLSIWRFGTSGGLIHGTTLAVAAGPVFINPFGEIPRTEQATLDSIASATQPDSTAPVGTPVGTPVDFRRGRVLGGAVALKDQPLQLILREPDYNHANITQQVLRTQFPYRESITGCAHAVAPNIVELKVPPEYRRPVNQVDFWLARVSQTFLRREPGFTEERTAQLVDEMCRPNTQDSQRMRIAVTMINVGMPAVPLLQRMYQNENPGVVFHAAYAGLRIGDHLALEVLLNIVKDKDHPYRLGAVQALGQPHRFRNIADRLAPLLDESNTELRVAAYQSMTQLGTPLIQTYHVGTPQAFRLDVVACRGPYLVFVTRVEEPRIILFGGDSLAIRTPMFLSSDRADLTIRADSPNAEFITMMRANPSTGKLFTVRTTTQPMLDDQGKPVVDKGTKQTLIKTIGSTDMKVRTLVADVLQRLASPPEIADSPTEPDARELRGLGLNYSQTVHVLYQLSKKHAIAAPVVVQPLRNSDIELSNEVVTVTGGTESSPVAGPRPAGSPPLAVSHSQPDDTAPTLRLGPGKEPPKIGN